MKSFDNFAERFSDMKNCNGTYYTTVIVDTNKDQIIGTASLIVEKKFIHECALVTILPQQQIPTSLYCKKKHILNEFLEMPHRGCCCERRVSREATREIVRKPSGII